MTTPSEFDCVCHKTEQYLLNSFFIWKNLKVVRLDFRDNLDVFRIGIDLLELDYLVDGFSNIKSSNVLIKTIGLNAGEI